MAKMHLFSVVVLGALSAVGVSGEALAAAPPIIKNDLFAAISCHRSSHGGAPEPTQAPNVPWLELVKRQAPPTSLCGVYSTNTLSSLTCPSGQYCGFATSGRSAFGCCASYQGGGTLTGCYFPTSCVDYSNIASVYCAPTDTVCLQSTKYCTLSAAPYCGKYVDSGLTAYACFTTQSVNIAIIDATPTGSITSASINTPSLGISSSSRMISSSASTSASNGLSVPSSSINVPQSGSTVVVPFTQTQQTIGITTPTTSSSSHNLATNLEPAAETWLGFLFSFVLFLL